LIVDGIVSLAALLLNVPFGYKRATHAKFSPAWFIWLHASIPFIVLLRYVLGAGSWMIPVNIALAMIGQCIGARIHRRHMRAASKTSVFMQ